MTCTTAQAWTQETAGLSDGIGITQAAAVNNVVSPTDVAIAARTSGVFSANELQSALLVETLIEVVYPAGKGAIGIRGSEAPLSWEHTEPPISVDGDVHLSASFCARTTSPS